MSYNSNEENKQKPVAVNYDQLYNSEAGDFASTMKFGLFKNYVNISIYPKLENATDDKVYDYENGLLMALNPNNLEELIGAIDAINKSETPISYAINGNNKVFEIGSTKKVRYVAIHEIANGRKTNSLYYIFRNSCLNRITNSNSDSDKIETVSEGKIFTEWNIFSKFINDSHRNEVHALMFTLKNLTNDLSRLMNSAGSFKSNGINRSSSFSRKKLFGDDSSSANVEEVQEENTDMESIDKIISDDDEEKEVPAPKINKKAVKESDNDEEKEDFPF
jgi:hypothetical protein